MENSVVDGAGRGSGEIVGVVCGERTGGELVLLLRAGPLILAVD